MLGFNLLLYLIKVYFKSLYQLIIGVFFLVIITTFFSLSLPILFAGIVEVVLPQSLVSTEKNIDTNFFDLNTIGKKVYDYLFLSLKLSHYNQIEKILSLSTVFLFFTCLASFSNYFLVLLNKWGNATITILIRKKIISHLFNMDYLYFQNNNSGDLISRIMSDVKAVSQGMLPFIQSFIQNFFMIIVLGLFLVFTNKDILFISITLFLIQLLILRLIKDPIKKNWSKFTDKTSDVIKNLNDTFSFIRITKIFGTEDLEKNKISKLLQKERNVGFRALILDELKFPISNILTAISLITILFITFNKVTSGEITIQGGIMFLVISRLIITPIMNISTAIYWLQAMEGSYEKISKILKAREKIHFGNVVKDKFEKKIQTKNLKIILNGKEVLKNISIDINKGEKIFIIGSTGSGKTTLINSLLGLYKPDSGEISIDQQNIFNLKLENYRAFMSLVSQDTYLLDGDIKSNIVLDTKKYNEDQLKFSIKNSSLDDFLSKNNYNLNTLVGEKGTRISGGEKQRICIARAIYKNSDIIIFDEATSALDINTEKAIVNNIFSNYFKNKTVIFVSHRINLSNRFDKILVMRDGEAEFFDSYQNLLAFSDYYKSLLYLEN